MNEGRRGGKVWKGTKGGGRIEGRRLVGGRKKAMEVVRGK